MRLYHNFNEHSTILNSKIRFYICEIMENEEFQGRKVQKIGKHLEKNV